MAQKKGKTSLQHQKTGRTASAQPANRHPDRRPAPRQHDHDYVLIWGRQPVREALAASLPLQRIMLQEGAGGSIMAEIRRQAEQRGIIPETMARIQMDALTPGENHQGIIAAVAPYRYRDMDALLQQAQSAPYPPFLLILDHLQDPRNLGSLLRTAAAAGVDGVIIPRDRACGITPAVYKTSAGTVIYIPVAQVVNVAREIDRLKEQGFWIAGAEMKGATVFYDAALPFPLALVLGGEGSGLSRLVREKCDLLLRIPMVKDALSLNVAVAGGILIYEACRQRNKNLLQPE